MKPVWHPLSTLLLENPRCYATPQMLRLMLMAGSTQLRYVGDAMWPTLESDAVLDLVPADAKPVLGSVVVGLPADGIPLLGRIEAIAEDHVVLCADGDPNAETTVPRNALIGKIDGLEIQQITPRQRTWHRLRCELTEATSGFADGRSSADEDPAKSVQDKYDLQAPHYSTVQGVALSEALMKRLRESWPLGARILVIGSGVGRESFELAAAGYTVTGIDFSQPMIDLAHQKLAEQPGLPEGSVKFECADIRDGLGSQQFDGALFTYDVYSFIPKEQERLATLKALHKAIKAGGSVFLSARRTQRLYDRALHTYAWLKHGRELPWGASHTRFVTDSGELQRSFVQVFSDRMIERELQRTSWQGGRWEQGYCRLQPRG